MVDAVNKLLGISKSIHKAASKLSLGHILFKMLFTCFGSFTSLSFEYFALHVPDEGRFRKENASCAIKNKDMTDTSLNPDPQIKQGISLIHFQIK